MSIFKYVYVYIPMFNNYFVTLEKLKYSYYYLINFNFFSF